MIGAIRGRAAGLLAPALFGAGTLLLPFFRSRPNRTATGAGVALAAALPAAAWAAAAMAAAALLAALLAPSEAASVRRAPAAGRGAAIAYRAVAATAGPFLLVALAVGAAALAEASPAAFRVSFGVGFWIACLGAWLLAVSAPRGPRARAARAKGPAAPDWGVFAPWASLIAFLALALSGSFESLALFRELASRRQSFAEAVGRHLAYGLFPTAAAALAAFPLGRAACRSPRIERPLFFVASAAQTIPTLSLLGLLILPLSALGEALPALRAIGVRGVGWAPASVALFLYALLPLAANARAGFGLVPAAAKDAGRGLGMSERQLFLRVELPLAAPHLAAGLRTAIAQNLGNAVLAGLIGGGGLGGLVFLGLAQAAPDLVLLGSLPVVAGALAADRLLGAAEAALARRAGLGAAAEAATSGGEGAP